MRSAERQTGKTPPQLVMPPFPENLAHVWRWFLEIAASRGGTGFGPAAIGYTELAAWARLTGRRPTPFEIALLRRLDQVFLATR